MSKVKAGKRGLTTLERALVREAAVRRIMAEAKARPSAPPAPPKKWNDKTRSERLKAVGTAVLGAAFYAPIVLWLVYLAHEFGAF